MIVWIIGVFRIIKVFTIISGGMHDQYILGFCIFYGIIHPLCFRGKSLSKATVDNRCPIIHGISDAHGDILIVFIPIWNSANTHEFHVVGYTVDTNAIVTLRSDNSSYVGTVAFSHHLVFWVSISVGNIGNIITIVTYWGTTIKVFVEVIVYLIGEVGDAFLKLGQHLGNAVTIGEHLR